MIVVSTMIIVEVCYNTRKGINWKYTNNGGLDLSVNVGDKATIPDWDEVA